MYLYGAKLKHSKYKLKGDKTLSKKFLPTLSRSARFALVVATVAGLSACSITKFGDIPEYLDRPFEDVGPKEYITTSDLQKIRLGMSYLEVTNRLGPPMLSAKEQKDRWDYVLRKGSGVDEEYLSYGVYFKDDQVIRIAPLEQPPASIVGQAAPAPAAEPVVEATAVETVAAPEPTMEVSGSVDDAAAINDLLNGWVAAWSAQDVSGYLGYYADTFEHGKGSRSSWENQRRKRLSSPSYISISLSDVQIDLQSESLAEVKFKQDYSSSSFTDSGNKVLVLSKASGEWKIQSENFSK